MVEQRSPKPWVVGSNPARPVEIYMETQKPNFIGSIRKFFVEVASELKKVSWTNRKDLIDSTWVVLVSSAFLGLYIGVMDFILSKFVASLIK